MKRPMSNVTVLSLLLYLSLRTVLAQEFGNSAVDVTFTASIAATTCLITVSGGTGDGKNQSIVIGDSSGQVQFDDVVNHRDTATVAFSLEATECPSEMPLFFTTIRGAADPQGQSMLENENATANGAKGVGIYIATAAHPDTPLALNQQIAYDVMGWRFFDKTLFMQSAEANLIASLAPTSGIENVQTGNVQATAVFHFDYN